MNDYINVTEIIRLTYKNHDKVPKSKVYLQYSHEI